MAHSQTPGWRWRGANSRETWLRRNAFLEAAEDFAPTMVQELVEFRPLARRAVDAMRDLAWTRPDITWRHIDDHVAVMRRRRRRTSSPFLDGITDPARRRDVYRLHRALPAWAERWFLVMPSEDDSLVNWVLEAALGSLALGDEQLHIRQPDGRFVGPIHVILPAFEAEPWTGDETPARWRTRQMAAFARHIDALLAPAVERLSNSEDLEPVPRRRSETHRHIGWAARWQVGGEGWDEFLEREGLLEKKTSNVRAKILEALSFVSLVPRPGMRTV